MVLKKSDFIIFRLIVLPVLLLFLLSGCVQILHKITIPHDTHPVSSQTDDADSSKPIVSDTTSSKNESSEIEPAITDADPFKTDTAEYEKTNAENEVDSNDLALDEKETIITDATLNDVASSETEVSESTDSEPETVLKEAVASKVETESRETSQPEMEMVTADSVSSEPETTVTEPASPKTTEGDLASVQTVTEKSEEPKDSETETVESDADSSETESEISESSPSETESEVSESSLSETETTSGAHTSYKAMGDPSFYAKETVITGPIYTEPTINDNIKPPNALQVESAKTGSPFDERKQINASKQKEANSDKKDIETKVIETKVSPITKTQHALDEALYLCQAAQDFWQKGELDNALVTLDQAYSLILKVDNDDKPKLMQQKEDLRFMISKRILEIYASRNIVVNGDHKAIPMVMNRHVQAEIDLFKGAERKFFIQSYKRSGKFRPKIIKDLKEAGIPVELSWLPLIESGFKVNALSRSRALGLWQFIPSTGYKFGLKRDMYVDERLDPVKSTKAAIAYLKELHQIFGDWATVLAAYNCGEGRVLRVIRSQNINYLDNFWDLYERLPRETARYVPKFMATLHIINNPGIIGLDLIDVNPPLKYETVTISRQVHLKDVAKTIGVSEKLLKELNPELRYKILPGTSYALRVPPGKDSDLIAKIDKIPVSSQPRRAFVYHRIRPGESLSVIAMRYRTSVRSIIRANNIRRSNFIVAGKRLKIPLRGTIVTRSTKTTKRNYKRASTHVVRRGDSLWIIANRYGTTTRKIQRLNNLYKTTLQIGQVLKIPEHKKESPTKARPKERASSDKDEKKVYLVKYGDSPYKIAHKHNMSLGRFLRINQLTPRSRIYPNQKLYVE